MAGQRPFASTGPGTRRFRAIVPQVGSHGRPQPVWRVGSVLRHCLGLSRVERSRLWRFGGVTVNGKLAVAPHLHCYPGDVVEAWYAEASTRLLPQSELLLDVLFEDEWLLAVNKPAGQLSHPARSEQCGTVANAVAARYRGSGEAGPAPVRLVHRLDRNTSGVLLLARDATTARALARQRAHGQLTRTYLILVLGRPPAAGEISAGLGADTAHRTRRVVYTASAGTPPPAVHAARTSYRVVQYGHAAALLAARLHTGRTHQLRAHFASIGHPVLADDLYGAPTTHAIGRQALHAWRASLRHPVLGAQLTVTAPMPRDFRLAAKRLLNPPDGDAARAD